MQKTNKLTNLYRLNFKSARTVLVYLSKKMLRIKVSPNENETYILYNYLLNNDGYIKEETATSYICLFKRNRQKTIVLRKNPSSDSAVFNQVYGWLEYQKVVDTFQQNFPQALNSTINIIDAGSNIGLTSLYFLDHFKSVAIVNLEPETENFKSLTFNLSAVPENCSVLPLKAGLWSKETYLRIVRDFRDQSDWSFRVEESNDPNDIKAYSVNSLVKKCHWDAIDILKIDIEGSEKEVFNTSRADLSFLNQTKCIAIEIHDEFDCREAIYNVLIDYNFTFFNHGELTIGVNQNWIEKI